MLIPIDSIVPNPEQPRQAIPEESLAELAESIRTHGLINPIAVEAAGNQFILIDGERRWRAAKLAGLREIEASVRPGLNGSGSLERLILATVANLQREDMNPLEKARAFQKLLDTGMSLAEVASTVGMHISSVTNYLLILRANALVQESIASGAIPADGSALRAILAIEDPALQRAVVQGAAARKLPAAGIMALARRVQQGKRASKAAVAKAKARDELSATWAGKWNMIAQAGNPHIDSAEIRATALETCQNCALYLGASPKVCRDCPAVDLLKNILRGQNGT